MGVMIDSQLPYLVAMDDDILSTGVCIFHLKVRAIPVQASNKSSISI